MPERGNSATTSHYIFTDLTPIKGRNFYRLRSVDLDAKFALSDIRLVSNNKDGWLSIYPEPVENVFSVSLEAAVAGNGVLRITDMGGRNIYEENIFVNPGPNTIKINAGHFSKGL